MSEIRTSPKLVHRTHLHHSKTGLVQYLDPHSTVKNYLFISFRMKNENSGGGLRINQNMSKSIEQQIDVYTKTREEIRKILQVHNVNKLVSMT